MAGQKRVNRIPIGVVAGISVAILAAVGSAAWWTINSVKSPAPPRVTTTAPKSPLPASPVQPPAQQKAQIYWLKDTGSHLELVPKSIMIAAAQPDSVLKAAFNDLLSGPEGDASVNSTIPKGTKLRSVKIQQDGIHVDLSQEFTTGGGSAAMTGRVAQVIYTATTLQPNARVWIDVEGKPLDVLGGEGLELEQPMTRQSFTENFTL